MSKLPEINQDYLLNTLTTLLNIPSPTGYTDQAMEYLEGLLGEFPSLKYRRNTKGALIANWPGESSKTPRGLTAHVDTLGAMVKEIKSNGRLKLTQLGGYTWNTIEGEGCTVLASGGETVRGTVLLNKASGHVHGVQGISMERSGDTMEVRLGC